MTKPATLALFTRVKPRHELAVHHFSPKNGRAAIQINPTHRGHIIPRLTTGENNLAVQFDHLPAIVVVPITALETSDHETEHTCE